MIDVVIKGKDDGGYFPYKTIKVISTAVSVQNSGLLECVVEENDSDKKVIYIPIENIYYCKVSEEN